MNTATASNYLSLYSLGDFCYKTFSNQEKYVVKNIESLNNHIQIAIKNDKFIHECFKKFEIEESKKTQQKRIVTLFNIVSKKNSRVNNLKTFHYSIGSRVLVENGLAVLNPPLTENEYNNINLKFSYAFSREVDNDDGPIIENAKKISVPLSKKNIKIVFNLNKLNDFLLEEILSFKDIIQQRQFAKLSTRFDRILKKNRFWKGCEIYERINIIFEHKILNEVSIKNYLKKEIIKTIKSVFLTYTTIYLAPSILAFIKNSNLFEGRNIFKYSSDRWSVFFNGFHIESTGEFFTDSDGCMQEINKLIHDIPMGPIGTFFRENNIIIYCVLFFSAISILNNIDSYKVFKQKKINEITKDHQSFFEKINLQIDPINNKKIIKPVLAPCGIHDFDALKKELSDFNKCRFHNKSFSILDVKIDRNNFLKIHKSISEFQKKSKNFKEGFFA